MANSTEPGTPDVDAGVRTVNHPLGKEFTGGGPGVNATTLRSNKPIEFADKFWVYQDIEDHQERWCELYPYQLMIVKVNSSGQYEDTGLGGTFTLPLTPQQLNIRTPFAIQTSVTLRGILEEHNGAPLREISFSGTTGMWPHRRQGESLDRPTSLESVFAGTLGAASNLASSVSRLSSENKKSKANLSDPSEETVLDAGLKYRGTGYYQFHQLSQFLERYALLKRGVSYAPGKKGVPDPSRIRLAFCMWKDKWIWLVSPKQFELIRSEREPYTYRYSFVGTAWKRITLDEAAPSVSYKPIVERENGFQNLLTSLTAARQTMQNARNLIGSVSADINRSLFTPIREVIFFAKDLVSAGAALADLPNSIIKDFEYTVIMSWDSLLDTVDFKFSRRTSAPGNPRPIGQLMETELEKSIQNKNLSLPLNSVSPLNKIFDKPLNNLEFFESIEITSLEQNPELLEKVEEERERVASFTRSDFEERRSLILAASADIANEIGLGNDTFNRLVGRNQTGDASAELPAIKEVIKEPSPEKLEALFAIQEVAMEFDRLVASKTIDDNNIVDRFNYMDALTEEAGIVFDIPKSKFAVPVPFDATVETISLMYLGDPDRWLEIATLNNLRAPYIDEVGFVRTLLTNGSGNKINIDDDTNLYIGQPIKLSSSIVPTFSGRIMNIEKIVDGNVLVTVDSNTDLSVLKTSNSAQIKAYLPGTVNSEQLIFIPSPFVSTQTDLKTRPVPGISDFDNLVKVSGIDFLLTSDGDLAVTPDGDVQLAYGLTNIVQAARLKLDTTRGSLLRHPSYGFGIEPGISTADVEASDVVSSIKGSFMGDDRFKGIESILVEKVGSTMKISLLARVQGVEALVPITVQTKPQ